jgi:hypothetical protein
MSRSFTPAELRQFLEALDRLVHRTVKIVVIGGGAIALAYGIDRNTRDIDTTADSKLRSIRKAIEQARRETGLEIPISDSGGRVGAVPSNSDARLIRVMPELDNLEVWALEAHDLALSKGYRGESQDLAAIKRLHKAVALELEVLIDRYLTEMRPYAPGSDERLDEKFVALIDALFGEIESERVEEMLAGRRKRHS